MSQLENISIILNLSRFWNLFRPCFRNTSTEDGEESSVAESNNVSALTSENSYIRVGNDTLLDTTDETLDSANNLLDSTRENLNSTQENVLDSNANFDEDYDEYMSQADDL